MPQQPRRPDVWSLLERAGRPPVVLATALVAGPSAWLAYQAVAAVVSRLGHPGAALDDSYIHFQYARAIAEGHPFRFQSGEPFSMGATSLLWPLLLAPFYLAGFHGESILWPAWALAFASLGLLARETYLLTRPLAGSACAAGATAMVLSLSALTWCAASGMEVVPFAFCLALAARLAGDWLDGRAVQGRMLALAWIAPLLRPEGAVASCLLAATFVLPRAPRRFGWAAAALAGPVLPPALSLGLTGSVLSSTAQVKLLSSSPYLVGHALTAEVSRNLHTLFGTLFDGEVWSAEFVPKGGAFLALLGLAAIVARGVQARAVWRAVTLVAIALTICAPCFYVTFLWNRLRYLWPFAPFWLMGLACLARVVSDLLGTVHPRMRAAGALLCGAVAGMLWTHQSGSTQDVADSASGIDRQQAQLGRWANENLPADASIGVNDTGAIAYFSDRRTFDIVGLTTSTEGRYWVAGAASRFEHYERLYAASPSALPTHFIVYPEWMACDAVLGPSLHEATVNDSTILGGRTMRVYEADYSLLGSGERPWTAGLDVFDALDVADLESEATHAYELLGARDGEEVVVAETAPSAPTGPRIADGGRSNRARERFTVDVPAVPATGLVRMLSTPETRVRVLVDGLLVATLEPGEEWGEYRFPLGESRRQTIELQAVGGYATVFHYWFARDSGSRARAEEGSGASPSQPGDHPG